MVGGQRDDGHLALGQLELDLEQRSPLGPRLARGSRGLLVGVGRWAPLWIPLIVLAQLLVNGWLPTRAEARRLDEAELEVHARARALEDEAQRLEAAERMLDDEVYRERVRRSLLDPAGEPLRLLPVERR
jgi:hypothetical protein